MKKNHFLPRIIDLEQCLQKKSHFLLGPRSTGKSTLIKNLVQQSPVPIQLVDLLDNSWLKKLWSNPNYFREVAREKIIIIDEVQKYPQILNDVHWLIENKGTKFILTGSSARKLKTDGVNLLGGRAWMAHLFPLTFPEIPSFDLIRYLSWGGLPHVYQSSYPQEELEAYTALYVLEEIQKEALTRNMTSFTEFLTLAALSNGQEINFQSFASDCGVSPVTIKNYFQILLDTLIQFEVTSFLKTKKRKAITRSKFYFFDLGIISNLCKRSSIIEGSEIFGNAFEHFIAMELRAYLSYHRKKTELKYWRSTSDYEVDFILYPHLALEIKSAKIVQDKHLKGLRAFKEENLCTQYIVISLDSEHRTTADGIEIYPWELFLKKLWSHQFKLF